MLWEKIPSQCMQLPHFHCIARSIIQGQMEDDLLYLKGLLHGFISSWKTYHISCTFVMVIMRLQHLSRRLLYLAPIGLNQNVQKQKSSHSTTCSFYDCARHSTSCTGVMHHFFHFVKLKSQNKRHTNQRYSLRGLPCQYIYIHIYIIYLNEINLYMH